MSFRAAREELERQARVQDRKFLDGSLFLFELIVPTAAIKSSNSPGTEVRLFYPLVVSPNSIYFDEPFTVAISPGTNGGLVVEENGIIQRKIRLEGTTGFAPKPLETSGPIGADYNVVASYSKRGKFIAGETFSGQKHFQFLQDKVFRTYADLKRDPTYARDTKLIFHNLKDEESWRVVPETFTLNRQSSDGPLYRYQIQLNARHLQSS